MEATVSKIDVERVGTQGEKYFLVCFRLAGGGSAKTYLCSSFRNFNHWKGALEVGAGLINLKMKAETIVDADSRPVIVFKPPTQGQLCLQEQLF